jgi:hypothetical protein
MDKLVRNQCGGCALIVELRDGAFSGRVGVIRAELIEDSEHLRNTVIPLAASRISADPQPGNDPSSGQGLSLVDLQDGPSFQRLVSSLMADGARAVAFMPAAGTYTPPDVRDISPQALAFKAWLPDLVLPPASAREHPEVVVGWIASLELIAVMLKHRVPFSFAASGIVEDLLSSPIDTLWVSSSTVAARSPEEAKEREPILNQRSRILAVVPHYRCEDWLCRCLRSLTIQARPPDSIVVVDDGSAEPPRDIVGLYPQVTLLRSRKNVGPYNLIQTVIGSTDYDAYLFQDADDWSTYDRLQLLLSAAERTGAELIGSQELRLESRTGDIYPVCYPEDVNRALSERWCHPLLHPSSLVSRSLIQRIGGFATGLRFGGDTEFLIRATYRGRIANIPRFSYVRRVRPSSLTTDPVTGLGTPLRRQLQDALKRRDEANRARRAAGHVPSLSPLAVAPAAALDHVCGPKIAGAWPYD